MQDNDLVADSLGKNLLSLRTAMLVLGGALAGLSGAILVGFITLWAPSAWGYAETIVLFAAVIIGGAGNHRGAVLGAILVPVAFEEATRYIPAIPGRPGLVDDLQWVAIGLLIVLFLWFRPQGVLPERRRRIAAGRPPSARPNEDVLTLAGDGRVLMIQPAVFLLDEPTANLAPQVAAELFTSHVKALAEAGAAVLVVEQRARAVLAISDYTYVLGGGRVLMDGTPARLAASQEFTESFFGATRDLRWAGGDELAATVPAELAELAERRGATVPAEFAERRGATVPAEFAERRGATVPAEFAERRGQVLLDGVGRDVQSLRHRP